MACPRCGPIGYVEKALGSRANRAEDLPDTAEWAAASSWACVTSCSSGDTGTYWICRGSKGNWREGGREGGLGQVAPPPPYTLDRTLLSRGHRCAGLMQCPQSSPPAPRRLYLGLRRKLVPLLVLDVSDLPILHLGKKDRPVKARGGGGEGPQAGQFREGFARNGTLDWTASPGGIQGGSA